MTTSGEQSLFNVHEYDMYGSRMVVCDNSFIVLARNDLRQFFIGYEMFSITPSISAHYCHMDYMNADDYVQSIAASPANPSLFVYMGENLNRTHHFIGIINVSKSCVSSEIDRHSFITTTSLEGYDIYTLDIDPRGFFAYVIGWDSSWIYNLRTFQLTKLDSIRDIWQQVFKPFDVVILDDNQHAIIVGYSFLIDWSYRMAISLVRLNPPNNITLLSNEILLPYIQPIEEDQLMYSPMNDLVIAINKQYQMLIGIPRYNFVFFGYINISTNISIHLTDINIAWTTGSMFGKSVAWLDNSTFAVIAYSTVVSPWSSSQVLVFNVSSPPQPTFTYPNNQQILNSSLQSPNFSRIQSFDSGNLAILLNNGHVQLLCVAPPGMYTMSSKLISNSSMVPFYGCQPSTCSAGTFKSLSSIGPCHICPSGKKNSKINNATDIECELCDLNSYCPMGAVGDVPQNPYTIRISQAVQYPENSDSDAYDDILVQNMVRLQTKSIRCLLISPLFWTLITAGVIFLIIVLAGLFRMLPKYMRHYLLITAIFKRIDLIGEGELWIGGLLSFSVFVQIIFAYAFSGTFIYLYPIENSSSSSLTCDSSIHNAKFSTGFHLLSMSVTEDEAPIFRLLNEQPLTLSIDLLNTMIVCSDVKITLKSGVHEIPFYGYQCNRSSSVILSISLSLPNHLVTVDFNFSTSYSIGGLRICLSGPQRTEKDMYTVRSLQTCDFFGETNATLGHQPHINLVLTKVINKTEPLVHGDSILYSGLFVPTVTAEGISDEVLYDLQGQYKRYLFTYTFLAIDLSETQFYILNRQDPIVRVGEMIFHNILFTIAIIELFGFSFLIFKLAIIPFIRWLITHFYNKIRVKPHIADESEINQCVQTVEHIPIEVRSRRHSSVP